MRAALVRTPGGPFEIVDAEHRDPGPTDVVVRVRAAGLCHTDLSLAKGEFGQQLPAILGHEGAGEITRVGSRVANVSEHDRVVISWVPSCGHCYTCVRGETMLCRNRPRASEQGAALTVDGQPVIAGMGIGTFAEEVVLPATAVVPLPDDVPFEVGAVLGCAVPTGFGAAVNSARVRVGEHVLVIGAGAVGLNAVQGARISGAATITVVDPSASRRELAASLGATATAEPGAAVAPDPGGFDVVIDAVGIAATIRPAWDAARRGGRVVVVGAGRSDDPVQFSAQELFHDQKQLIGSFYGASDLRRDVPRLVDLWRSGVLRLDPFLQTVVSFDEFEKAAALQRAGEVLRVVVTP
jgi:S-(hydroxymethyl)glutathione dehydrogenase / alcohol dehydrogenase